MSDRDDLKDVQSFLSELIANLKTATAREGTRDTAGGLFPTGINDIFAKLTVGGVTLELEVSSASAIHGPSLVRTEAPVSPLPDKLVRPMYVEIPKQSVPATVEISFNVTQGAVTKSFGPTPVPTGLTQFNLNTGQVTAQIPE